MVVYERDHHASGEPAPRSTPQSSISGKSPPLCGFSYGLLFPVSLIRPSVRTHGRPKCHHDSYQASALTTGRSIPLMRVQTVLQWGGSALKRGYPREASRDSYLQPVITCHAQPEVAWALAIYVFIGSWNNFFTSLLGRLFRRDGTITACRTLVSRSKRLRYLCCLAAFLI